MSSSSEEEGLDDLEFDGDSDASNDTDMGILDALEEDLAAEACEVDEVRFGSFCCNVHAGSLMDCTFGF